MKRTMIRITLINLANIDALELLEEVQKLVKDFKGTNVEFNISEAPSNRGIPEARQ